MQTVGSLSTKRPSHRATRTKVAQLAANAATVLYLSTNQLQLLEIIDYLFGFKNATTAAKIFPILLLLFLRSSNFGVRTHA
jgi:hypothetical protein